MSPTHFLLAGFVLASAYTLPAHLVRGPWSRADLGTHVVAVVMVVAAMLAEWSRGDLRVAAFFAGIAAPLGFSLFLLMIEGTES